MRHELAGTFSHCRNSHVGGTVGHPKQRPGLRAAALPGLLGDEKCAPATSEGRADTSDLLSCLKSPDAPAQPPS